LFARAPQVYAHFVLAFVPCSRWPMREAVAQMAQTDAKIREQVTGVKGHEYTRRKKWRRRAPGTGKSRDRFDGQCSCMGGDAEGRRPESLTTCYSVDMGLPLLHGNV